MTSSYWPESIPRHLDYPRVSVGELLVSACRRFADLVAVEDGSEEMTYATLLAEGAVLAHALRADGIGVGNAVVLSLPNGRDYVVAYLGVQLAGAAVSPANPLLTADALRRQIQNVQAVAVISHPECASSAIAAREGTPVRRVVVMPGSTAAPAHLPVLDVPGVTPLADYVAGQPPLPPLATATPDDIAHLPFTGGTTGVPKAVRVLHRNAVGNIAQALAWRAGLAMSCQAGELSLTSLGRDDAGMREGHYVALVVGPMYHSHALLNTLVFLTSGARIVIAGRFRPERLLELIEAKKATYITGSPAMWHALLKCDGAENRDLTSVEVVSSGAAPIDPATMNALYSLFPNAMFNEGWGLTEGTCLVTATPGFHGARRKPGSVGQPVPDTDLEVRDPQGEMLGPNERGELWIRGPQVTDGYLGRPELTAEQYVDGWLRTGDLGYVDDDGFIFVSGRLKDMLLYKGYNVYPRELEDLLAQHPDVDTVAVVGRDDEEVGQVPVAFVAPQEGAAPDPQELMAYVAARVLPYMKIRELHLVDQLPTNAAGKILKTELREQL